MSGPSQPCLHPLLSVLKDELCSQFLNFNPQILTGKRLELDWHRTFPSPSKHPRGRSPGQSRMVQAPLPSSYTTASGKCCRAGASPHLSRAEAALWKHLSPAHTSLTQAQTQQPVRQVQAALTLQPCKLKQRGKSRQRLKWDYFLMWATTTTHHNYPRGNYKKLSITEDEVLSFSRWAVSTRKL